VNLLEYDVESHISFIKACCILCSLSIKYYLSLLLLGIESVSLYDVMNNYISTGSETSTIIKKLLIITNFRNPLFCLFIGALTELRKTTIGFFLSVCLSKWNNSAANGRIYIYLCFRLISKSFERRPLL